MKILTILVMLVLLLPKNFEFTVINHTFLKFLWE